MHFVVVDKRRFVKISRRRCCNIYIYFSLLLLSFFLFFFLVELYILIHLINVYS